MSTAAPARRAGRLRAAALLAILLATLALPEGVAAHVTRTVGPYTIFVVLVEEPTFEDNRAGFQFWVHRGDAPVGGLEATLNAQATGHGVTVDLAVSPLNSAGFYVVDGTRMGEPFDPLGGGAWSLILTGRVAQTQVNEIIPVVFPSYPRVGTRAAAASTAVPASGTDVSIWLIVAAAMALGLCAGLWSRRRDRPRRRMQAAPPV
jgi:hypothetical protein